MRSERRWLALLASLTFLHGLLYAFIIPPWQGPDEDAHFFASYMYAYKSGLPKLEDIPDTVPPLVADAILSYNYMILRGRPFNVRGNNYSSLFRTVERYSPSYVVYGLATRFFLKDSFVVQLYVMRLVSVVINVLIISIIFSGIRHIRPESLYLAIGATLFVVFWPQHAFVTSSVNDGNLAELFTTLIFYFTTLIVKHGATWRRLFWTASFFLLAFVSKNTTLFLVPLLGITVLDYFLRKLKSEGPSTRGFLWKLMGWSLLCISLISLLFFRLGILQLFFQTFDLGNNFIGRILNGSFGFALWWLYKSFWVTLGWMNVPLPDAYYPISMLLLTMILIGWITKGRRTCVQMNDRFLAHFFEFSIVLILLMLFVWMLGSRDGLSFLQGRFLFSASFPISFILTGGWFSLHSVSHQKLGLQGWVIGWVVVDAIVLFNLAILHFYQIPFGLGG